MKVEVKSGEDFLTTITFQNYVPGDAPVRVDNYCEDLFLKIHQKYVNKPSTRYLAIFLPAILILTVKSLIMLLQVPVALLLFHYV